MSVSFAGSALVDQWLQPLTGDGGPCGTDLGYDNDFLALTQAATGKPESQFEAAVPPDWRLARQLSESLFGRTRDLRIALLWLRAVLNLDGFVALPEGLRLINGLLESFWDALHPLPDPDDGDPYARMNALADLREANSALGDVRRALLFTERGLGDVRVRTVEIALGHLAPRSDDLKLERDQLTSVLATALDKNPPLRDWPAQALAEVKRLTALLAGRVDTQSAPDLAPLQALLWHLVQALPAAAAESAPPAADAEAASVAEPPSSAGTPAPPSRAATASGRGLSGEVLTREDAVRAIDLVCAYLERAEPSSPAPLLLRRARRLINHNFLQLMKELAPEALAEVARVMGVDPESVTLGDGAA